MRGDGRPQLVESTSSVFNESLPLRHHRNWLTRATLVLVAFALIYNVSFAVAESASTARIAVLALMIYLTLRGEPVYMQKDWRIWLLFIPLPYVIALAFFTRDFGQFSRFANLALYAFLGANMLARAVDDVEDLLEIILAAACLQALAIAFSFVSLDYREWFDGAIASGSNVSAFSIYRAPGLSSTGGSALSIAESMGVLAGGLLLYWRRTHSRMRRPYSVVLQMLLCLLSCVLVGRTGLLLSAFYLVVFCVQGGAFKAFLTICAGVVLPAIVIGATFVEGLLPGSFSSDYFLNWAFGFFTSGDDASVRELESMPVPPLSIDTFTGTGLVTDTGVGNPSGHDSGLVQAYYAMGLPMAALFYAAYAAVLWRLFAWLPWRLRLMCLLPLLAIEVKEPFVFKHSILIAVIAIYTAVSRSRLLIPAPR